MLEHGKLYWVLIKLKYDYEREFNYIIELGEYNWDGDFTFFNDWDEGQANYQMQT